VPSREFASFVISDRFSSGGFVGLVAEREGEVVGGAFVDERAAIAGIGPVAVDSTAMNDGVGRELMQAALERERARGVAGVRLVQTAYHYRSLAL
jgi:predicted N-acetyltransferase YhbS